MSTHFNMGAINKTTNEYEYATIADKSNKYKCPSCDKDIILKKGKIKRSHFAHFKSTNPCNYYNRPNETQIHKDAKMLLKTLLDNKNKITLYKVCHDCRLDGDNTMDCWEVEYSENSKAVIEHKFEYNDSIRRSADVALVENEKIKCIFEICYKNKTREENRPEPWFEMDAETLIKNVNSSENIQNGIDIECIRNYKCEYCKTCEIREKEIQKRRHDYIRKRNEEKKRQHEEEKRQHEEERRQHEERQKMYMEDERTLRNIIIMEENRIRREEENRIRREENRIRREEKEREEREERVREDKDELNEILINNNWYLCQNKPNSLIYSMDEEEEHVYIVGEFINGEAFFTNTHDTSIPIYT